MTACIDLNADLGEGYASDDELLAIVSSCNVACGGHAGDEGTMAATIRSAIENGVAIGAHPSYPDREGFGRVSGFVSGEALYESLIEQLTAIADIAAQLGVALRHVKPHGALYNDASTNSELADVVARATAETPGRPMLVGPPGSALRTSADRHGLRYVAEAFVDRAYEPDGRLVARSETGAVHDNINTITAQAVSLCTRREVTARNGEVIEVPADTLCIHGDTEGAALAAQAVRDVLEHHAVSIRRVASRS